MDQPAASAGALAFFLELGQAFHTTLALDPLLTAILERLQGSIQSEGGSLWLLGGSRETLTCIHAVGTGAEQVLGQERPAAPLLTVVTTQPDELAVKIDDIAGSSLTTAFAPAVRLTAHNLLAAPLVARGEVLGVINLVNKRGAPTFTAEDLTLLIALSGHAAVALQNAQLYERHTRSLERQKLLDQISQHLQRTLDIQVLIPRILEEVNKAINAEGQSLWLLNSDQTTITCRFASGSGAESIKRVTVPVAHSIVGSTVLTQESLLIADAQKDARFYRGADDQTGFVTRSLMSVPLVREGRSIGAIQAVNKRQGGFFTQEDVDLLRSIADSAALAIENARLFTELQASYDNTLDALAAALDLRDRETEGHSRRVVEYTARLAHEINLPEDLITEIRRGALIHDIGKIGVPDAVLHKPGPLDPDERKIIERHPQSGYEMLSGIPYLQEEIKIVLGHQEKWDGTGYPNRLQGEAIPLGARLFAIADTFDALTSDRPYRKGRPYEAARQVIQEESGRQFDPLAVDAFLAVSGSEWEQIRAKVMEQIAQRRAQHAARLQHHQPEFTKVDPSR